MTDRVFPSSKPTANGDAAAPPAFPATKAQAYGATNRSGYRPQPSRRRHRRGCCCRCCLWTTVAVLVIIFLLVAAAAVFYLLYRPHRPSFSVTSFRLAYLNTTSSGAVNSDFNLTVTARNPNKKIEYVYSPVSIRVIATDSEINVGEGTIPPFAQGKRNTTVLRSTIKGNSQPLDSNSLLKLKSATKAKSSVKLKVKIDTKVKVKAGSLKTPRIGIRVTCDGITATIPASGGPATVASTANGNCKVDTRIKIWKWTI
ncbi:hypothetical protein SAY86_026713 [Trapa natans]|uniref:Late embryogenesis abundant protein LEA-2 subgroup domain-containing protein n=1 Tax=Trapa natans TaxID=22666 RepID=A0AAN7KIZ9_TRANT|nr:hypothetical protein SAY86_026713 [Trapa natans]